MAFLKSAAILTTCHTATKSKNNLRSILCFDVENEEDKEDVQSPPLTTDKTKIYSNVTPSKTCDSHGIRTQNHLVCKRTI